MKKNDPSSTMEPMRTSEKQIESRIELEKYFDRSIGTVFDKLHNFAKYVPTQYLRKFICRYEMFRKILNVHGSIVECGVLFGGGLMEWAHLSEIFEPFNHTRNIIGFDTFSGFPSLADKDKAGKLFNKPGSHMRKGGLAIDSYNDLLECIELFNNSRYLNHIQKVKLIKGDIKNTLHMYLKQSPHTVVSLLWLDFDIYEPTIVAIKQLIPRIPKGGIIAFDELNHEVCPGETIAVMEEIGLNNLKLERFPFGGTVSYAIIT